MQKWIKLSLPSLSGNERRYVDDAVDSEWIVPLGPYVNEFEQRLGKFLGHDHVVALSAGTAAIHLGLIMAGVGEGDEVICQSMTFSASANPIVYQGARPVFVDSERDTWNIDPVLLRVAIEDRFKVTGRLPKAIIPVHLYGMPCKIDCIIKIADEYGIAVVEDAAEALGSRFEGRACGTFGRYGALSFNGNKIITTSGGGALICPDGASAKEALSIATQAREDRPYYYHTRIGYNYRLSNVSAAIGCAQIETLDRRVERRREIHALYREYFADRAGVHVHDNPDGRYESNFWLTTLLFDHHDPEEIRVRMFDNNIETRRLWRPMHMQPIFADAPYYGAQVSDELFERGLCLPSGCDLTDSDVERVAKTLISLL